MGNNWPKVKLGDVLAYRKEFINIDDLSDYKRARVQLHAQGVVLRDEIPGALIKTKQQQVCRAGEFLVAEIDAKVGGFGLVPEALDGAIVSSHYFLFVVDHTKLDKKFLDFFIRTPHFGEQVAAQGSTNYAAIRPSHVLNYEIPLPPLPEQQRIVVQVEELAAKVEEALGLRTTAFAQLHNIVSRTTDALVDNAGWHKQPLEDLLVEPPRNGLSPQPEAQVGGRPMLRINAVSSSPTRFVDLTAFKQVEVADQVAEPFVLQNNDVFIVRYNGDINRVAKAAIFKQEGECRTVFPDKLMRLRPQIDKMLPDFLVYALSARGVREQIEEIGKTTAGNIGISGNNAKSFIVSTPPLQEQKRILEYLDDIQRKADTLKTLQTESSKELAALIPSILDKAFRGEL